MGVETSATIAGVDVAAFARRHLRRNFFFLSCDFGMYGLGMAFASVSTILPAFAQHLGASNLVIGAIPAVVTLGFLLPQLFFANHTERLPLKMPFVLAYTVWERLPLPMLAVVAYFLALRFPALVLAALILSLAVMSATGGALMPAWYDIIAKVIPNNYRGRLMAIGSTIGTGCGMGGAAVAGYLLERFAFPTDYALCFGVGFVFLMLSWIALALVTEPAVVNPKPHVSLREYFSRLPTVLRRDHAFSWYLASRGLGALASMANGFYTVFALKTLGAPEWQVARFTLVVLASQTVANMALGWLADRVGHKPVLILGAASLAAGNVLALLATQTSHVYPVFACMSVATAAGTVSGLNLALEFAPDADRPTYIGLASTLIAPIGFAASLIGGAMADITGYRTVFALAGLAAALNAVLLITLVREPRGRFDPVT